MADPLVVEDVRVFPLPLFAEAGTEASGEGWRGQDPFSDLRGLLTEIQALRGQLEKSIETNSMLQSKLEEQLAMEGKKAQEAALTVALQTLSVPEWPPQLDKHGTAPAPPPGDCSPVCVGGTRELLGGTLAPRSCPSVGSRHPMPQKPRA